MTFNWLRRPKKNRNSVHKEDICIDQTLTQKTADVHDEPENDIEHQNSTISFNDEEYVVKALTNEQVEDCKEAFAVFVDEEGKTPKSQIYIDIVLLIEVLFIDSCSNCVTFRICGYLQLGRNPKGSGRQNIR